MKVNAIEKLTCRFSLSKSLPACLRFLIYFPLQEIRCLTKKKTYIFNREIYARGPQGKLYRSLNRIDSGCNIQYRCVVYLYVGDFKTLRADCHTIHTYIQRSPTTSTTMRIFVHQMMFKDMMMQLFIFCWTIHHGYL